MLVDREQQKRDRIAYRDTARELFPDAQVSHLANVLPCPDGAYVEVTVWVTKDQLNERYARLERERIAAEAARKQAEAEAKETAELIEAVLQKED